MAVRPQLTRRQTVRPSDRQTTSPHAAQTGSVSVVVLVADGARLDTFAGDLGDLPALRRLRDEGGLHPITSVFPSVTGPAYTPFLLGRVPGPVGVPGIRWFDRSHEACKWPDHARSYVGYQFSRFDSDLDSAAPTIFELARTSIGALSVVTRGLAPADSIGTLTARSAIRAAYTHFRGRVEHWLDVDREVADTIPGRIRDERPDYVFAAFTGVDKASHARGHDSALAREALRLVDVAAGRIRGDAERLGYGDDMHLWIVSDHGHSEIHSHENLAAIVAHSGLRTVSHPWTLRPAPDAAVMVSGNAMAHVYLGLQSRGRQWWTDGDTTGTKATARSHALVDVLLALPSADLLMLPHSATRCEIRSLARGTAFVSREGALYRYDRATGDPLGYGADVHGTADETHDFTRATTYPDAIVQILALAGSPRAGDVILSAAPGWDFRARYEPIPHRSAHGALHRDHMLVPLLTNRTPARAPRRTTDVFASTLSALGIQPPAVLDGQSFL